jgi:hypothetical protein
MLKDVRFRSRACSGRFNYHSECNQENCKASRQRQAQRTHENPPGGYCKIANILQRDPGDVLLLESAIATGSLKPTPPAARPVDSGMHALFRLVFN